MAVIRLFSSRVRGGVKVTLPGMVLSRVEGSIVPEEWTQVHTTKGVLYCKLVGDKAEGWFIDRVVIETVVSDGNGEVEIVPSGDGSSMKWKYPEHSDIVFENNPARFAIRPSALTGVIHYAHVSSARQMVNGELLDTRRVVVSDVMDEDADGVSYSAALVELERYVAVPEETPEPTESISVVITDPIKISNIKRIAKIEGCTIDEAVQRMIDLATHEVVYALSELAEEHLSRVSRVIVPGKENEITISPEIFETIKLLCIAWDSTPELIADDMISSQLATIKEEIEYFENIKKFYTTKGEK